MLKAEHTWTGRIQSTYKMQAFIISMKSKKNKLNLNKNLEMYKTSACYCMSNTTEKTKPGDQLFLVSNKPERCLPTVSQILD